MKKLINKTMVCLVLLTFLWPDLILAESAPAVSGTVSVPSVTRQAAGLSMREDAPTESGVQVIASTGSGIVLELVTPDFDVTQSESTSGPCDVVRVTGYGELDKSGWPRLPASGTLLGLPPNATPSLSILNVESTVLPGKYTLCPVPQPIFDVDAGGMITYRGEAASPDPDAYANAAFYPAQVAEVADTGWMRNQYVAQVRFHPFQYNPVTGVIKHYTRIRVLLQFGDAGEIPNAGRTGQSFSSSDEDAFDHVLAQIVANYDEANLWRETPSNHATRLQAHLNASAASQTSYKLMVNEDGLYEVTYAELAAAGVPVDTVDPHTFMVHTQGTEVALYVPGESDGVFDAGDSIIFYGKKMNTQFTDVNVYWLTWGAGNGLRMAELDGTPTGNGTTPEAFRTTQRLERNKTYQSLYPSGADKDRWYWAFLLASAPTTMQFTTTLNTPVSGPLSVTVRGLLKGYDAIPQHHTRVYLNGNLIADALWASKAEYFFTVNVPSSMLVSGTNTITVEAPMDQGITRDYVLVNWFEIDYDRAYTAVADQLLFDTATAGTWEYAVTGFTTATIQTFDVTTPTVPVRIVNPIIQPEGDVYTVRFEQTTADARRHIAATRAQFKPVLSIAASQPAGLRAPTNGADYIIITHGSFYTDVLPLADYRATQGLRTRVVDVQSIYDEFSYGVFEPAAIRDFLAYAYAHWTAPAPAYVLLMGDGNYDFKNYTGRGELNYIPPFLADVDPWMGEVAADNRYVCVNGEDNFPDMHLGRLPVKTRAEAQAVVNKILDYEMNPAVGDWNQNILFVADNPDTAGDFQVYSDAIADGYLPAPYIAQKVYYGRTHTTVTAARSAIISAINAGRLIVNYVGHGARTYWASEQLFRHADIDTLTNAGRLPFVAAMACLDGYYIHPSGPGSDLSSTAEAFVRTPGKGAIATWSSTGMGTATAQDYLDRGLFKAIFTDDIIALGSATLQGKLYLYTSAGWYRHHLDIYLLFGDPALRLNVLPVDVSLTQATDAAEMTLPGSSITYTLTFTNAGPAIAHRVVISSMLSTALVDQAVTWAGATLVTRTGSVLAWDVSDLVAGQSGNITITGVIPEMFNGPLITTAEISTSSLDDNPGNNVSDPIATLVSSESASVELTSFTASPLSNTVLLAWETANELMLTGFNLYRASSLDAPKSRLNGGLIPAQAPGEAWGASYVYTDDLTTPGATYLYWVEVLSLQNTATLYGPIVAALEPSVATERYAIYIPLVLRAP
ncbi:MAG: C25 family cysteine peptidase [Anaerolineae bacterium]